MNLQQVLEKYLPLISGMLIPVGVFAVGMLAFLVSDGFAFETAKIFHIGFYVLSGLFLIFLMNINDGRPLYMMGLFVIGYVALNYLKNTYGGGMKETGWYQNLSVFLPMNLLLFYMYAPNKLMSRKTFYLLLFLSGEYALVELLGRNHWTMAWMVKDINVVSWAWFILVSGTALFFAVRDGRVLDYGIFFAILCVWLGMFYGDSPSGRSLFFFLAQGLLFGSVGYTILYNRYYDETTGFYSRYSYQKQSKSFPLKYTLGIVSVDGYDKFRSTLGRKKAEVLMALISEVVQELTPEEAKIYRYADSEFLILYQKTDKKEAFKIIDDLRRSLAGLSFALKKNQKIPIKLTVSCSIAEKKRSDTGAAEVLARADKALQATLKFSHNVTSKG